MANPSDFFAQMMPYAQQVSQRTGLDPRLVLAQAALETGYGQSAPGNNFFGIKSHGRSGGNVLQTQEFEGGRMVSMPQSFRGYESPAQSFMDYADFVTSNPRYRPVLEAGDLESQIRAMGASGYATDPSYATKLAQIAGMVDPNARINIPGRGGNMQPQGLLSTVSTQGQEPEQLPFFQRPEVGNLLDSLAIGFSGMTLNPNQALIQSAQERIKNRSQAAQTAQQRNRTLEYLRTLGTPQAMEAIRYAEATGDVAGALKMAQAQPDRTALMQNYEYALSQGMTPEQARAWVSSGTTINMPGEQLKIMPDGRVAVSDPSVEGGVRFVTPPGSTAASATEAQAAQRQSAAATAQDSLRLIDSVLNNQNLESVTGMFQGRMPALTQSGTDLVTRIEQLQGQAFLQAFESLKGGGAITEREGIAAQNAIANLNRAQSGPAFRESLQALRDIVDRGRRRAMGENISDGTSIGGVEVGDPY